MVSLFSKPHLSRVNARHLLDDLADSYSYEIEAAVLVEIFANALDAKSSAIRITTNSSKKTLSIEDNGHGMNHEDFESYHDLAESHKERGKGIGFAGLGAKLAHKVAEEVFTETSSPGFHGTSEWKFKDDDLQWSYSRRKTLGHIGTKTTLALGNNWENLLDRSYIEHTIQHHYGALLDPFLSELFTWDSIYPEGISFYLNSALIAKQPIVNSEEVSVRTEIEIQAKGRKRVGRAIFLLMKDPVPDEEQGIVISTYGKVIRRDPLTVHARQPELVRGWFESPELVECLTLNKQDFFTSGREGEKFKRIRRDLQAALAKWLTEIGEARESEARHRAPRLLERETAQIIRNIPELRYLFATPTRIQTPIPNPQEDAQATFTELTQSTRGEMPGKNGGEGIPAFPGAEEGQALQEQPDGTVRSRTQPRTIRSGPHIERIAEPGRSDIGWVTSDTVMINTSHPAYVLAERQRHLSYHERVAILFALCQEASVEPEEKFHLLNRALTEWAKQQQA